MISRERNGRLEGDSRMVAKLYRVSPRSVRRHCTTVGYQDGVAMYDVVTCEEPLKKVVPRPGQTAAAVRVREAEQYVLSA